MKKIVLVAIAVTLSMVSCSRAAEEITVVNNSNTIVSQARKSNINATNGNAESETNPISNISTSAYLVNPKDVQVPPH